MRGPLKPFRVLAAALTAFACSSRPEGPLPLRPAWPAPADCAKPKGKPPSGDFNGDGWEDALLVSRLGGEGIVVRFGAAPGQPSPPVASLAPPEQGMQAFGLAACAVGDVDGDGFGDIALSGLGRHALGVVYVYRGSREGILSKPSWVIGAERSGDGFGSCIAAGDLDKDGVPELLIGATGARKNYVVSGLQFRPARRP